MASAVAVSTAASEAAGAGAVSGVSGVAEVRPALAASAPAALRNQRTLVGGATPLPCTGLAAHGNCTAHSSCGCFAIRCAAVRVSAVLHLW